MRHNNVSATDGRPLTVLHVAPTPFFSDRGCHMRIRGIICALEKKSVKNILCTYHHGRDIDGIDTVRTPAIPGYTRAEAGPSPFKYVADIFLFYKVCAVIFRRRPDIIHGHLHEGALIGWMARQCFFWRKIPLVFDVQGSLVGELDAHGYFRNFRLLMRVFWMIEYLITRMPNYFVCSSQSSVDILKNSFHVRADRVSLVNDGADIPVIDREEIKRVNTTLRLPQDRPVVIYTGALMEAKGLNNLFDLILEAKRRDIDCHFLVVGYPDEVMKQFCERNSLKEFCTIAGRIPYESLGSYLGVARIAVEPKSTNSGEASGKLLNYMGAGLPVVCFDTENNRQILGDSGYYAPPGEIGALADHIEVLVQDLEKGQEQGSLGKRRVMDEFSWDAGTDKIYAIYRSCLAS